MNPTVFYILIGGFIAWRLYRRVQRNFGRQKLQPRRAISRLAAVCVLSVVIVKFFGGHPPLLEGFGGGLVGGAILGFFGLRLTRFETTEEGHFYTPDTRIGVALTLILAGRLLYRYLMHNPWTGHGPPMPTPLTFLIAGVTFGYYFVYYIGLFVHTHDKKPLPSADSI